MLIEAILKTKGRAVAALAPDETIATASSLLASQGIGAVVIVDGDGATRGIVSERDIVRALAHNGESAVACGLPK